MAIFGQAVPYIGSESNYCQNGKNLSQIIAKNGNIWTSCTIYRKANQIIAENGKNLGQFIAKNGNIWTRVVLLWMPKVAKNGKKR